MLLQSQGRRLIVCPGIAPAPYGVARPALLGVLGIKPGLGNATIAAHQSRGIGHAAHLLGSPRRLESRHAVTNSSPFRRGPVSAPSGPCPPGTWGLSPRAPRSPPRRRGTARPSSLPSRGRPPPALARSGRPESRASPSRYGGGIGRGGACVRYYVAPHTSLRKQYAATSAAARKDAIHPHVRLGIPPSRALGGDDQARQGPQQRAQEQRRPRVTRRSGLRDRPRPTEVLRHLGESGPYPRRAHGPSPAGSAGSPISSRLLANTTPSW